MVGEKQPQRCPRAVFTHGKGLLSYTRPLYVAQEEKLGSWEGDWLISVFLDVCGIHQSRCRRFYLHFLKLHFQAVLDLQKVGEKHFVI